MQENVTFINISVTKKTFQAKTIMPEGFLFTYDNIRIIKHTFYDFTAAITSVCGKILKIFHTGIFRVTGAHASA